MKRELSRREKVLLLILAVLVIVIVYIKIVFEPINRQVETYQSAVAEEQLEIENDIIRFQNMKQMQSALREMKAEDKVREIPNYDNRNALMQELHQILSGTKEYAVDFSAETGRDGYIVLRPVELSFQTGTYAQARAVIDALGNSRNLNQISDVTINSKSNQENTVQTTLTITYFEIAE